jgi:uncharacterized protein YwgA
MEIRASCTAKFHFNQCTIIYGAFIMPTLKQLELDKAALDLKIAQSIEAAKKMDAELEKARLKQEAIDKSALEIQSVLQKYNLRMDDVFPTPSNVIKMQKNEGKTLSEMRQYFTGR